MEIFKEGTSIAKLHRRTEHAYLVTLKHCLHMNTYVM